MHYSVRPRSLAVLVTAASLGMGCDPSAGSPSGSATDASPTASIPARKLAGADAAAPGAGDRPQGLALGPNNEFVVPDAAAPPPKVLEPEDPIDAEEAVTRELTGVSLDARWLWRDVPPIPTGDGVDADAIREARESASFRCRVDLAPNGRMRLELLDVAMPMLRGAAILARADRYGTVVLWPNRTHYRVAGPGSIRAMLGERRVDVSPLTISSPKELGAGTRLTLKTRRMELSSPVGKARLEMAKLSEAGGGGPLLCRLFADLVGVHPSTLACVDAEVVLSAQIDWTDGGGLGFEVSTIHKRIDMPSTDLLVPPGGATYLPSGLPTSPEGIFFSKTALERFRKHPAEPPPAARPGGAPGEGVLAVNQSDRLLYLLLDTVPIAAVPPWSERYVIGPQPGRYLLQWRTFLGDLVEPQVEVDLPARVTFGAVDAGAESPDGGV